MVGRGYSWPQSTKVYAGTSPPLARVWEAVCRSAPSSATSVRHCFGLGDNGDNPLLAQVGLAMCRVVVKPGFLDAVRERGTRLETGLRQLAGDWGAEWRGRGLLQALVLAEPVAAQLSEAARMRGLLVNAPRPNVLRFMPQLGVSAGELSELCVQLDAARRDWLLSSSR